MIHGSPTHRLSTSTSSLTVITNLAYGATSEYLRPGRRLQLPDPRRRSSPDLYRLRDRTSDLAEGDSISALAAGLLASSDEADQFRVIPLADGFEDPGAGNAAVRIVHASADAPTVDIDVGSDGTVELEGVERFADSGAAGVPLPADFNLSISILAGGARDLVHHSCFPKAPNLRHRRRPAP